MLISCAGLLCALWPWAMLRPGVMTDLVVWPLQAWAGFGVATSVMSTQAPRRRLHFTLALLLLASTWALPAWHLAMPQGAWIAAGQPGRPGFAGLQALWAAEARSAVRLDWVAGLWQGCWPGLLVGLPVSIAALILHAGHPVLPAWSRHLAKSGVVVWLFAAVAGTGAWLSAAVAGSPTWFWALLVVGLPFQLRSGQAGVVLAAWGLCVAALLSRLLSLVVAPAWLCDASLALAGGITLACGVAWYARMEAVARFDAELQAKRDAVPAPLVREAGPVQPPPADPAAFDLIAHLDSPQAQEGADKYTRE